MKSRVRVFTLTVLLLLIHICPAVSQDITFNKVPLSDEKISGTITGITQYPGGIILLSTIKVETQPGRQGCLACSRKADLLFN